MGGHSPWLEVDRKLGQQEIAYWLEVRYFVLEKLFFVQRILPESRNFTELSCIYLTNSFGTVTHRKSVYNILSTDFERIL